MKRYTKQELVEMSDEDQIKMLAALILSRRVRSLVTPDQIRTRSASKKAGAKKVGAKKAGVSQFRSRLKSRADSRAKAAQAKCTRSQLAHAPAPKKQNRKGRP